MPSIEKCCRCTNVSYCEPCILTSYLTAEGPRTPDNLHEIDYHLLSLPLGTYTAYVCANCICSFCQNDGLIRPISQEGCRHCVCVSRFHHAEIPLSTCLSCERCDECKEALHYECNKCENEFCCRELPRCSVCATCENCCTCVSCSNCDYIGDALCSECEFCSDCCDCNAHSGIILNDNNPPPVFHLEKLSKDRFMAAEIEVAESRPEKGEGINQVLNKWKAIAVEDGSLPIEGYEINTAPAQGKKFTQQIIEICDALTKANARITSDCGLHIHLDCRDLRYYDLKRVIQVYSMVENNLFEMLPKSRQNNRYCRKINYQLSEKAFTKMSNKDYRDDIIALMYGPDTSRGSIRYQGRFKEEKYSENRYQALNLHSWFYRGSIEFRHHSGTINATKIINWAKICQSIINFGVNNSEKDLGLVFKHANPDNPLLAILSKELGMYFLERKLHFQQNRNSMGE